jgi:hypothetical protein
MNSPASMMAGMTREVLTLKVTVSDPWSFVTPDGSNIHDAQVLRAADVNGEPGFPLLIRLAHPVAADAVEPTAFFVAETHGDPVSEYMSLTAGEAVDSRVTGVTEAQAGATESFRTATWRGRTPAARVQLHMA